MIKITKTPKHINMIHREYKTYVSEYSCPTCGVNIIGAGIKDSVTRFKCDCGQELIIDKHVIKNDQI